MNERADQARAQAVDIVGAHVLTAPAAPKRALGNARRVLARQQVSFVRLSASDGTKGLGEVCALPAGAYVGPSDVDTLNALNLWLEPLVANQRLSVESLDETLGTLASNPFARASVEAALWHVLAQQNGAALWQLWEGSRTEVPFGAHLPAGLSPRDAVAAARRSADIGARRLRVKIAPGNDVELISALRSAGPKVDIAVDCNGSYDPDSVEHQRALHALSELGVTVIEQPYDHNRGDVLERSAALQRSIVAAVALDESIGSLADAKAALDAGACSAVNIKAARVGGFARAIEMCELTAAAGTRAWCGGMYETDLGRAFNLNLMSRSEFDLPGDGDPPSLNYECSFTSPAVAPHNGMYRLDTTTALGGWTPSVAASEK